MSAEPEPSIQRAKYISELVFLSKPLIQAVLASYQKKKKEKRKPPKPTKPLTSSRDSRNSNKAPAVTGWSQNTRKSTSPPLEP